MNLPTLRTLSALVGATSLLLAACSSSTSDAPAAGPATSADAGADDATTGDDATADAASADPLSWPVDARGPFSCGYRVLHASYVPPGDTATRTIEVHVWYPTDQPAGAHPKYIHLFDDPDAWTDAPVAPSAYAAGMPVLVHSHGYKGFAGNSSELMCYAASHGWLAVAPEHLGNALMDTPKTLPLVLYAERPLDVRAALDLVAALPSGDPLAGKADMTHVAMSGHSFGTYTSWAIAGSTYDKAKLQADCDSGAIADCRPEVLAAFDGDLSDARPQVAVAMAGGLSAYFGVAGASTAKVPVLLMSGSLNDIGGQAIFDGITGVDLTWVDVQGGCHQLFGLGNTSPPDGPECAVLPDADGFAIADTWLLAYLRYHVLADRGAKVAGIVDGSISASPLVTRKAKTKN